jgi:hypothetical protein
MGWTSLSVSFSVKQTTLNCRRGDKTTATLTITGETDREGAHYRAYCYQEEAGFDDQIYLTNRETVGPGEDVDEDYKFTIECDEDCAVKGPDGTTGDSTAVLYGYVEGTGGITDKSSTVTVECA